MRKLFVASVVGGLMAGGAWLLPASAANDCGPTDPDPSDGAVSVQIGVPDVRAVGGVCTDDGTAAPDDGHVWVDGDSTMPGQTSGYVEADSNEADGVCADDNGGPSANGSSPTCPTNPDTYPV
jgi:hypothetical protein